MTGWKQRLHIFKHISEPDKYLEVHTYKNDGHFYHKEYIKGHDADVKLTRIRKSDLLELLKNYEWVTDTISIS